MTSQELEGQTALVTGAAKRIGREIALALAAEGVNVVVHYRSSVKEAEELAAHLSRQGVKSWFLKADLENAAEYESLVSRTLEIAERLDILVNSASIFQTGTLTEMTFNDLTRHMEVNAWAPFVLTREFARLAVQGKIVNILDARIRGYDWSHAAYILSKHALAELTEMSALAYAPDIAVNAVAPGLILPPSGKDDSYLDRLAEKVPLRRHGEPKDIADAVLYLLKGRFQTGQILYMDGGQHLLGGQPWTAS
jgi:pteridine reductase